MGRCAKRKKTKYRNSHEYVRLCIESLEESSGCQKKCSSSSSSSSSSSCSPKCKQRQVKCKCKCKSVKVKRNKCGCRGKCTCKARRYKKSYKTPCRTPCKSPCRAYKKPKCKDETSFSSVLGKYQTCSTLYPINYGPPGRYNKCQGRPRYFWQKKVYIPPRKCPYVKYKKCGCGISDYLY